MVSEVSLQIIVSELGQVFTQFSILVLFKNSLAAHSERVQSCIVLLKD